ncbi:MAG: tetratricopeptide repeat protein [Planctomycetota bacterium]
MNPSTLSHFARGQVLYQQSRYEEAEKEFRHSLGAMPEHAPSHAMLALCLENRKKYAEATKAAQRAIHLDPTDPMCFLALSLVYHGRNRRKEALEAIGEAIRLAPERAHFWGTRAAMEFESEDWKAARKSAETGLMHDPDDTQCANVRAMALVKLGRRQEAEGVIAEALKQDPENALSHANQGWTMLHQGRIREAKQYFSEALRLDPNLQLARGGMIEALKAGNPIYRVMLNYFLWMASLSPGTRWGVIIGLYVAYRLLGSLARSTPEAAPFIAPLLLAYLVFALTTWLVGPLMNLLLRFNRYGRYLLSPDQVAGSNLVGVCLAVGIACVAAGFFLDRAVLVVAGVGCGVLMIPVSAIYNCDPGWPRVVMALIAVGLLALGVLALGYSDRERAANLGTFFLIGCFLSTWAANYLVSAEVRR